jgi:hypothetical protein
MAPIAESLTIFLWKRRDFCSIDITINEQKSPAVLPGLSLAFNEISAK